MSRHSRYTFLDLFRTFFVVLMIEGHAVRALLVPEARSTSLFELHEILHGLTGPGFLFGAGFAFAIATQRRQDLLRSLTPAFFRRLWRAALLILIGYALHLPYFSLRKTMTEETLGQWNDLLAFGPLQCIGVALIFLRVLFIIARTSRAFLYSLAILTPLLVIVTPFLWDPAVSAAAPRWFSMALNGLEGSFYPLFPFAGFVLAGAGVSWLFLGASDRNQETRVMHCITAGGVLLIAGGLAFEALPFSVYPVHNFWYTSPNYFLIRLGILLLLVVLFWALFGREGQNLKPLASPPVWLVTLGIESFFVYIVHLLMLFGWLTNPDFNILRLAGPSTTAEALGIVLLLFVVLVPLAAAWRFLKKEHPVVIAGLHWWFWGMFLSIFIRNPY